jgi:hypothetical protein
MTASTTFEVEGPVLGGREDGQDVRRRILELLQSASPDAVLRIDFSKVQMLDFSAADELLASLLARTTSGELGRRRFYLSGVDEGVREGIVAVLTLRKRVCLEMTESGHVRVLGPLSPPHQETLRFAIERGSVTAADVAERFWTEPNMTAATNRLNALVAAGLLLRDVEQGGPRGARNRYASFINPQAPTDSSRRDRGDRKS